MQTIFNLYCFVGAIFLAKIKCTDITNKVFGSVTDGMPAAFGDFDSDELMDLFVLRNNGKSMEILLGSEEEPLLRVARPVPLRCPSERNNERNSFISSVVPGDFDGDALMDVLVTTVRKRTDDDRNDEPSLTSVYIHWGGGNYLNCSSKPVFEMNGQPLALDYNHDMIIDLFGTNKNGDRVFWIFGKDRKRPQEHFVNSTNLHKLVQPHAHAYLDLNKDNMADLFVTTKKNFEVWYGEEMNHASFVYNRSIPHPNAEIVGQSFFTDFELQGQMDLLTPVCIDRDCRTSKLLIHVKDEWHDLPIDFKDNYSNVWGFALKDGSRYTNAITLHNGDFNMDGYPDLLATLKRPNRNDPPQSFLLENVPCETACGIFTRTYKVRWNALRPFENGSVMAVFYDFYQDGILDVIIVLHNGTDYRVAAFKNSLDYDANFIKVMVLTGLTNKSNHMIDGRVGKKRRTYGTNLPGPSISYRTIQDGSLRHATAAQLPQSAHFSLNLPYTIFGLGRTPNFVDSLQVGLSNHSRDWPQIIPNSQMVVIPWPPDEPNKWKAQLFVTPSKVILTSVAALTGVCGLITIIIGVLHWKERQEDKKERQQESHRFHFDAM